jgi:hypothetical protein
MFQEMMQQEAAPSLPSWIVDDDVRKFNSIGTTDLLV